MTALLLILPVLSTAGAQILLKLAGAEELRSGKWMVLIGTSVLAYGFSFVVYSFAVRQFPISVVSPVTTIAAMLIIVAAGALLGEVVTLRQFAGIILGLISIVLILVK